MNLQHKYNNKLLQEKSPYLLQHAHNPVDWYPWGGEALARAVAEDKPIFLSIGYSTCHWCHVMERESFEDEEVARILNKHFIAIKVDREERPDVDHIYMSVCQAMTGQGGWPLTILMTPERKPFYSGTYFPKKSRGGYPGIIEILEHVKDAWVNEKDTLVESSDKIMKHMHMEFGASERGEVNEEAIDSAVSSFSSNFDKKYGGFGSTPKFPTPHNLMFLLRDHIQTKSSNALNMVEKTLESMYRGGMYDHIGFGFSRYSTDRKWLVPHFEKMLYDNALLAFTYIEVYQTTGKESYKRIAEQIFEYVLRDMTSAEGGFYSAEDADSEGVEGKFYVWSPQEIIDVLGHKDATEFCEMFDITDKGNFEGANIPNIIESKISLDKLTELPLDNMRRKLFLYREKRVHPYKDDKILTAWNGLMIAALAYGARVFGNKSYLAAAKNAVSFIQDKLIRADGRLMARYREGETAYPGYLDDYAFLVWGLIELYEASFDVKYLQLAVRLNDDMIKYFGDGDKGGYFIYGSDSEQLIARPKEAYDGAMPSGNSVAALNLLRLGRLTGSTELEEEAERVFSVFADKVNNYYMGHTYMLMALMFSRGKGSEIVIVGDRKSASVQSFIDKINKNFMPYSVVVVKDVKEADEIKKMIPYTEGQNMVDDKTTAYICENFACRASITDIDRLMEVFNQ
ncbi:MAG: Cellobiose 2-epimerase [Clostridia bacterium]|nr:Cellobiose 2-epimerase [Clostridia bacterium]